MSKSERLREKSKRVRVLLLSSILLLTLGGCKSTKSKSVMYAVSAKVTTINEQRGYVSLRDYHGIEWYWYCDTREAPWDVEEEVLMVMDNRGTEYVYDDSIVSITTEGVISHTVSR